MKLTFVSCIYLAISITISPEKKAIGARKEPGSCGLLVLLALLALLALLMLSSPGEYICEEIFYPCPVYSHHSRSSDKQPYKHLRYNGNCAGPDIIGTSRLVECTSINRGTNRLRENQEERNNDGECNSQMFSPIHAAPPFRVVLITEHISQPIRICQFV